MAKDTKERILMRSVRNTHRTAMKRMPFAWKSRSCTTRNEGRKPSPTEAERLLIAPVDSHHMDILADTPGRNNL